VSPYVTQDCVKVGHRSNSGIEEFWNWMDSIYMN
jgi:hypothetical protein